MAKVITKNSFTPGSAPSGLSAGELAVNVADKKIFVGNAVGGVVTLHDQNAVVTSVNGSTGAVTNLNAASATITNTNSSATWYPTFVGGTGNTAFFIDAVSTPLTYVPSSGTVSARAFDATFATNQVKLDSALGSIFNTDGTNTNTVVAYGFEYNGASPYFISSGNQGIFLVTQGLRISDGDYDQIYGPSTWGYTFPAANGTSGQAMFTNGDGQLYWGTVTSGSASGVLSINGATGAITNVAKTNEGNTFSVLQVMNAGITTSNLFVTSGSTFTSKIESTSTSDNIDIVATTDGSGLRIAQATSGAGSRIGAIRLGRASTTGFNTFLENSAGIFTIYNGINNTGTKLFDIDTTSAEFFVPIVGATFGGNLNLNENNIEKSRLVDYSEIKTAPTISSGTLVLDLNSSNFFEVSLNANITTLTISNANSTANTVSGFTLLFTADGTVRAVTWPASIVWPGSIGPTMTGTNGKKDFYSFISPNNGTNWYGFVGGQNY